MRTATATRTALPLLAKLKAAPNSAVHGAATAAGVAVMAVSGLVSPSPSPPATTQQPGPAVAQPAPHHDQPAEIPSPQPEPSAGSRSDAPDRHDADRSNPDSPTRTVTGEPTAPTDGQDTDDAEGSGSGGQPDSQPPREVAGDDSTLLTAIYLHAAEVPSRRYDVLPMSGRTPDRRQLGNYDTDIDGQAGLRLRPTSQGRAETRIDRRQRWALTHQPAAVLAGPLQLDIWVRPATAGTHTVRLAAFIDVCSTELDGCRPLTDGQTTTTAASGGWQQITVALDPAGDVTLAQQVLVLTVTAGPSTSDVLVAFDTTDHPAALTAARINLALSSPTSAARPDVARPTARTGR